jgi:phosphate transport system substrate-binding protein
VPATLESIAAAAASHSTKIRDDFKFSIVDAPGAGAYPISSFTWIVVPVHNPLPKDVVVKEAAAIARIH